MKKSFAGKVVVICGASSGIGRESALLFAEHGARLVLSSRRQEKLQAVAQEVRERGAECMIIPCDIEASQQIENLVEQSLASRGQIDVLVITAGRYIRGRIVETGISHFKDAMRTNFFGAGRLPARCRPRPGVIFHRPAVWNGQEFVSAPGLGFTHLGYDCRLYRCRLC